MTHPPHDPAPPRVRLAISGTFGVGKTTTAEAVAIAAGIPRTHALTSREILALHHLPVVLPVDEAIAQAQDRVRAATAVLNAHARDLAARRTWRQRLRYALRY